MISDNFDISNYTGNKSFNELYKCYRIHTSPIKTVLEDNRIQLSTFDFNGDSNFDTLISEKSFQDLKISELNGHNAFHLSRALFLIKKIEIECLINSVIFFQIMMESDINDVSENPKDYFKDKWNFFLSQNNATETEKKSFQFYYTNIYSDLRIPVVHPEKNIGIRNISKFNFKYIFKNFKEGWFTYCFLLSKVHSTDIDYELNWKTMCKTHNIPNTIKNVRFRNIEEFAKKLNDKYLEELNN